MSARAEPMVVLTANGGGSPIEVDADRSAPAAAWGRTTMPVREEIGSPAPARKRGQPGQRGNLVCDPASRAPASGSAGEPEDSSDARNDLRAAQRLREGDSPRPCRRCSSCAGTLWTMRVGDDLPTPTGLPRRFSNPDGQLPRSALPRCRRRSPRLLTVACRLP